MRKLPNVPGGNNPTGNNQIGPGNTFERQRPYGAGVRMDNLTKSAPMSGAPISATPLNTPQRSQRRAVRPPQPRSGPAGVLGALPPVETEVASIFSEIASMPGAPPILQKYAERAAREAGLE